MMRRQTIGRVSRLFAGSVTALFIFLQVGGLTPAKAEPIKPVLELFTSQGCSSCPPADRHLGELQKRNDIVTLSLPVDYWDYLGWKDTLARPENAVRQRLYAKNNGSGAVYTPQIVVNGVTHAVGSRPGEVEGAIEKAKAQLAGRAVPTRIYREGKQFIVEADEAKKPSKTATIWFVSVTKVKNISIKRGENDGRTVSYYNVVRDIKKVGEWSGGATRLSLSSADLLAADADSCAILIQEGSAGPILGGAIMRTVGS